MFPGRCAPEAGKQIRNRQKSDLNARDNEKVINTLHRKYNQEKVIPPHRWSKNPFGRKFYHLG
uniref:Uncharacterized protein n=1 Tax=Klebsiella pneumoniae TaxID=573 RepID=A0A6M4P0F2_KLEPN|nr:hypothetical protein [Klebsiella pneumoniae]